jgi:hypothetical protein
VEFNDTYGHTVVPQVYDQNRSLGKWVQKQRWEYKNRMEGNTNYLNDERLKLLQDIEFVWNAEDDFWDFHFQQVLDYKARYGNCHVPGGYRRNPTLGRWVKGQRERYKKNKEKMLAGDAIAAAYMNSDRIKKLESIGFCFAFDTRTSDYDSTYDINDLPDLMEGFIHLEQSDQELDESNRRLLHNARTLFATVEEVRKNCRSTSATADNSAPARCGLGDLNSDTLENIIEFFQEGDDWKQKMSLVCTNWRRVVLRLDSCTIYDLSTADLLNVIVQNFSF